MICTTSVVVPIQVKVIISLFMFALRRLLIFAVTYKHCVIAIDIEWLGLLKVKFEVKGSCVVVNGSRMEGQ